MKILVNVFHPDLKESRINKAMMEAISNQTNITVRDLYREYVDLKFTETISLETEKKFLLDHDRIVFQHPIYWYNSPPLMKKWVEDVLTDDWAYGERGNELSGKEWLHAVSCAGPNTSYRPGGFNGFSLGEFLRPYQQTAALCKMVFCPTFSIYHVCHLSDEQLMQAVKDYLVHLTTEKLIREYES